MRRSNRWLSSPIQGARVAAALGMFIASCAVQPADDAVDTSTQAIIKTGTSVSIPDIKLTISFPDYVGPWEEGGRRTVPSDLPDGWDRVANGCNGGSDLGCQGFGDLGSGCDLAADGICRAYSPSAFSADRQQYLWTCRCEKPELYGPLEP